MAFTISGHAQQEIAECHEMNRDKRRNSTVFSVFKDFSPPQHTLLPAHPA